MGAHSCCCHLRAESYKTQQKDKLKQLELGGLVDYQPAADADAAAAAVSADAAAPEPPAGQQQEQQPEEEEQQQKPQERAKKAASKGKKKGKAAAPPAADIAGQAYAIFIVIGSKGDHYAIKITDEKRTCQCMDYRCDCVGRNARQGLTL